MKFIQSIAIALLMGFAAGAQSTECIKTGSVCVDSTASKEINGRTITLAQVGGCWMFEDTYSCQEPDYKNYCAALEVAQGCFQSSAQCIERARDGTCMVERKTYRCDDPSKPAPPNTVLLDGSHTIVDEDDDLSQCSEEAQNKRCYLAERVCTQGPETRMVDGVPVYRACWAYDDKYACLSNDWKAEYCEELKNNPACTYIGRKCSTLDEHGRGCFLEEDQYSCITQQGSQQEVEDCSVRQACVGGTCWESGAGPDTDFAYAVAAHEVARQGAVYKTTDFKLFEGVSESCREGWGGLRSCCKESPGAKSNNNIMMKAGVEGITAVGKYATNIGSQYMFDFMYSGKWVESASGMMVNAGDLAGWSPTNFTPSVELYGFGWSAGAPASGATQLGNGFYFDPTSFAIAVAIQVIMELTSCEPSEQMLGQHKGAGLSHYVGSYCSKKVLGACTQRSQAYCSFNSKLAKILNVQGRAQIGKSFGAAENPDCSGFSIEEFQRIDFSRIDLSEFIDEIMAATKHPDGGAVSGILKGNLNGKSANDPNAPQPRPAFGQPGSRPTPPPGG